MADAIDGVGETFGMRGAQTDRPSPLEMHRQHFAFDPDVAAFEYHLATRLQLLARVDEAFPRAGFDRTKQQTFHGAASGNPMAQQSRWKYTGRVQDEEIAGPEIALEVREVLVFDRAGAMEDEEARSTAFAWRMLRDKRFRRFEIEVRDVHARHGIR